MAELEHYGTKGMQWGKKKTPEQLKNQSFGQTKVYETVDWLKANSNKKTSIPWGNVQLLKSTPQAVQDNVIKQNLQKAKKALFAIGGKKTSSLKKSTVAKGEKAISKQKKLVMKRKIK